MQKVISFLYALLLVLVPIIFYPFSSEVFEFNKMVTVYIFTILIVASWLIRMILARKIIFKRTLLDIPLIVFLISQVISTVTSIDIQTSIFGYYSRFNGGLLSIICYSLLYWAFIANLDKEKTLRMLNYLIYSVLFVCIYAILEHFGYSISCIIIRQEFNTACWVQYEFGAQRVFATMGQPNWLAALIVAVIPFVFIKVKNAKANLAFFTWTLISAFYFLALVFTKSRSGLIAFGVITLLFWCCSLVISIFEKKVKNLIIKGLVLNLTLLVLALVFGTVWTPNLKQIVNQFNTKSPTTQIESVEQKDTGPALEVGGTESGEIRKIVWQGAYDLWKKYSITGSGVETFAYSYYETRPKEHNLVSEWDFLYNKAHNEYLNYLSTTGILGLSGYLMLITASLLQMAIIVTKNLSKEKSAIALFCLAALCGFISLLITNFFGFSVVATNLVFFLLPGFALTMSSEKETKEEGKETDMGTVAIVLVEVLSIFLLFKVVNYWKADFLYAQSKLNWDAKNFELAVTNIESAIKITPGQAIYHDQYARFLSNYAVAYQEFAKKEAQKEIILQKAGDYAQNAQKETDVSFRLSPRNVNIQRSRASILTDLIGINPKYANSAIDTWEYVKAYAPTDAKVFYKLGVSYLRINNLDKAIENFEQAVSLKPNYLEGRVALGLAYEDKQENQKAKHQFDYILQNLDPNHSLAKKELENL